MKFLTGGIARESAIDAMADRSGENPGPMVESRWKKIKIKPPEDFVSGYFFKEINVQ